MLRLWRSVPDRQTGAWLNAGLVVLAAALTGARLAYALVNLPYFRERPFEIFMLWEGGLTWEGAVIGAAIAWIGLAFTGLAANAQHPNASRLGTIGDRLYPLLPPLAVTAWIGCWLTGASAGAELAEGAWWGLPALSTPLSTARFFPLQPMAAISLLVFFWVLETRVTAMRPAGRLSSIAAGGLLLHLLVISLTISGPVPTWNGLRIDTLAALGLLVALLIIILITAVAARLPRARTAANFK